MLRFHYISSLSASEELDLYCWVSCSCDWLDVMIMWLAGCHDHVTGWVSWSCDLLGVMIMWLGRYVWSWEGILSATEDRRAQTNMQESFSVLEPNCRMNSVLHGPRQANLVLMAYASSEGSGEPAHPRSLARTFAARSYKQWVKRNLKTESQIPGPSEWLGMRS